MKKVWLSVVMFASIFGSAQEANACGAACGVPNVQVQVAPMVAPVAPVGPIAQPCGPVGCGGGGGCAMGGCGPRAYGPYFNFGPHGVAPGAFGVPRAAWYGPIGRYPKLFFAAPLRRAFGLPGFTPVRQFLFGRGAIRRQTRRAFIFGRGFCC